MSTLRTRVAIAILLLMTALGLQGGITDWSSANTPGRIAATIAQLSYGVTGALAIAALARRSRRAKPMLVAWALFTTTAAGLAPVVWGDAPFLAGVASAVAGAAICAGVVVLALPRRQTAT